nr:hypothetical protein [Paenibacillus polymyxa]
MTIATHHAAPHTTAEMDMAQMVSNRRIQSLGVYSVIKYRKRKGGRT